MVRKAALNDVDSICGLVESFAKRGVMLERPRPEVCNNIRDFFVYEEDSSVVGISSLHIWGPELGEIRSLAVAEGFTGRRIGSLLVAACIEEARTLGLKNIFALTYKVGFFEKLGFRVVDKMNLPHKIWGDCVKCCKFPSCDETAVIKEV